jgi:hypothetical protein
LAFRNKVTALAAPIHGKPKDELASDDLREQRRFRQPKVLPAEPLYIDVSDDSLWDLGDLVTQAHPLTLTRRPTLAHTLTCGGGGGGG